MGKRRFEILPAGKLWAFEKSVHHCMGNSDWLRAGITSVKCYVISTVIIFGIHMKIINKFQITIFSQRSWFNKISAGDKSRRH